MSDPRVKTPAGPKEVKGTIDGRVITAGSVRIINSVRRIAAAENYTAEDVLSNSATDGQGTPWEFPNVGESGVILKGRIFIQTTALTPRITLYLFSRRPTSEMDDNVANVAPSLADISFFVGQIDFPALEDLGGVSASQATPSTSGNLPMTYGGCDGTLYGIAVTREAITGETANDQMGITLEVEPY